MQRATWNPSCCPLPQQSQKLLLTRARQCAQVMGLQPRFVQVAHAVREANEGREAAGNSFDDDEETAKGMARLFAEAGEAHAPAVVAGEQTTHGLRHELRHRQCNARWISVHSQNLFTEQPGSNEESQRVRRVFMGYGSTCSDMSACAAQASRAGAWYRRCWTWRRFQTTASAPSASTSGTASPACSPATSRRQLVRLCRWNRERFCWSQPPMLPPVGTGHPVPA